MPIASITAVQLQQWLDDLQYHPINATIHTTSNAASNIPIHPPVHSQKKRPILLDVREPWEFETCHIPQSILMPMQSVPLRLPELNVDDEIVCICHHGGRSMRVAQFLEAQGFHQIYNLTGGVHAWAQNVDMSMPTY